MWSSAVRGGCTPRGGGGAPPRVPGVRGRPAGGTGGRHGLRGSRHGSPCSLELLLAAARGSGALLGLAPPPGRAGARPDGRGAGAAPQGGCLGGLCGGGGMGAEVAGSGSDGVDSLEQQSFFYLWTGRKSCCGVIDHLGNYVAILQRMQLRPLTVSIQEPGSFIID